MECPGMHFLLLVGGDVYSGLESAKNLKNGDGELEEGNLKL